ncbi:MAG: type IV pilus assembly protein PilM, partial [Gemmataceae bacterium]|nr:type IV pilus assembly protein PilM [Gemmataceae bacterium]
MSTPKGVWGIDLGQCGLKALRVELHEGQIHATNFDYIEHPKILSQPDADPDQLTREALEQFLSRNNLKGDFVAIGVPGQSGLARFVKLPPVEEKKIGEIVKFEAKQQIPFPLEEVVWDFQKIGAGEVADGFALETEIGLFAMKRDIISRCLQHYTEVGIEVDAIQMAPLALCNYVAYDLLGKGGTAPPPAGDDDTPKGKRKCVVGLDIGADSSNLVVTDGDKVIWQRPIPLGGNHLTRALSKELKLTFAKAEHLKRNAAKSPPDLKQILAALRPVLTDIVGEVQRSLGYFTGAHREAHVAYLVGLGSAFRLPGLQKYLSEKLGIEVKKPTAFDRLHGEEVTGSPVFQENILGFAVAYGLAVQGTKALCKPTEAYAKLTTNLLPPEIRKERQIRAKKPWAVAAAAMMFAGAGLMTGGYAWSYKAVHADAVDKGLAAATNALGQVTKRAGEVANNQKEVDETLNAVKSIIAGKDEQLNWIRLNEYINKCLPRPDGKNLELTGATPKPGGKPGEMVPKQRDYWNTIKAKEAAEDYASRVRGGESADAPIDEALREHLCRVDIESIHTFYVPSLKQFYDNAKKETLDKTGKEFDAMLYYDTQNPPKDGEGGWAVAIHGVTYHKDGPIFLRDTLVYNLARFCQRNFSGTTTTPPATEGAANKGPDDPIVDRVTHVFLYNAWTVENAAGSSFSWIGNNFLKSLISGGSGDATTTPGQAAPAPGGRDAWVPLTAGAAPVGGAGPAPTPQGGGPVPGGQGPVGGRGG